MWGFSSHPLIHANRLICLVGGNGGLVMAFDKDTGKEIWRALKAKHIGYCPPMMFDVGKTRQLIIWHPNGVHGLDPETGKVYWSEPWAIQQGSSMSISTPRYDDGMLFLTSFYNGSMMLKLAQDKPAASVLWKGKWWNNQGQGPEQSKRSDGLHGIMSTPFLKDGYIYGVCSYGQLRGLKAETGERLWETFDATGGKETRWGNAFLVAQGDRFFLFNEKGDLILARLSPQGYQQLDRAHILEPTNTMPNRPVVWSHPAFANKCLYARNDKEIVCVWLAKEQSSTE
jgi:outer membrane protein assembly factor BamB